MIIDCYSLYQKEPGKKTRYTLTYTSGHYEPMHKAGKRPPNIVPLYVTQVPDAVHTHNERKPVLSLSGAGGAYFSGVYIPDVAKHNLAYADIGNDCLLCILGDQQFEVIVLKGKKVLSNQFFNMLSDEDVDLISEIQEHREKSKSALINKGVLPDTNCPPHPVQ